jgi:L-cystine uptake protein TcyP (sodium:dicarboxylate symporter family)
MISIYSPHTVRRCSGDQNFRDRHILQRQPDEVSRIGCQAGMRVHQHSDQESAHSNGTTQWAQRFSMGCSGERANRLRVIPFVHLRLNTITLLELSHHLGSISHMHNDFLATLLLNDIVAIIDAHQIPLDHPGLSEAARSLLIGGVRPLEQPEAQQRSTRQETDDFGNGYHESLLG